MNPLPAPRRLTQITSADAEELRAAILAALRPVAEGYGIEISLAREIYLRGVNCHVRLECAVRNPAGQVLNSEALAYGEHQSRHRLPLDWLFRSFLTPDGQTMTLIGFDAKKRGHPFVIRNAEGAVFAAPAEVIRQGLGRRDTAGATVAPEPLGPSVQDGTYLPD